IRLGVLGDWDNPYKTMEFPNEAGEIRALAKMVEGGFVFKGLKPVNWCFDCGSALAEAEVEYQDKKSDAIDVAFAVEDADKLAAAFGQGNLGKPTSIVIWTTTPWTIPANQALNVHPDFIYALVDTGEKQLVLAEELVESCLQRYGLQGAIIARCEGRALEHIRFRHPFYERFSPVYLAEYVETGAGTGIVHSSPAYGEDDFRTCKAYGMENDDILNPVQSNGVYVSEDRKSTRLNSSHVKISYAVFCCTLLRDPCFSNFPTRRSSDLPPSTSASLQSTWPNMWRPAPGRVSFTPRPPMVRTTSVPARRTVWRTTTFSTRYRATASTSATCRSSAASSSGRPTRTSSPSSTKSARCSSTNPSSTATCTAGATRLR